MKIKSILYSALLTAVVAVPSCALAESVANGTISSVSFQAPYTCLVQVYGELKPRKYATDETTCDNLKDTIVGKPASILDAIEPTN